MTRALALSGGLHHPVAASAPTLRALLDVEVFEDIDAGLSALDPEAHDLLVVNALAFGMHDGRYDDAQRARYGYALDSRARTKLTRWFEAGRPVLALHTAVLCFDDWPRWGEAIGARWDWSRSWHPPVGPLRVRTLVDGVPDFIVEDERYTDLEFDPSNSVVAEVDGHPVAWTRLAGESRVACCTLGHDGRSLESRGHRALLGELLAWIQEERCAS